MKDIKRTLLSISPIRLNRKLGKVATALLFTVAVTTCSLTMWASSSVHGRALAIGETPTDDTTSGVIREDPVNPLGGPAIVPPFNADYSLVILGSVSGVPQYYGGLTFKYDDPNTLLIGGGAGSASGRIYQIPVTRDVNGQITGFSGVATVYPSAESTIGQYNTSVVFGPDNVLFVAHYPVNEVEQSKPGSIAPDKLTDLSPLGVNGTGCSIGFVPSGFPGAGSMKLVSWSGGGWYHCDFAPDGNGTFNIISGILRANVDGGPKGIAFVPPGSPVFAPNSVLITRTTYGTVATASLDANGDPVAGNMMTFVSGLGSPDGGCIDPLTGDFLFSTEGHVVLRVSGFAAPATPTPTPTPTATPTATATATPTATATVTPTVSPTPTVTPTATATPTVTPSPTASTTPTVSPTATPTPGGCVLGQGYWKNHEQWPVNQLQLGNRTYNRQELQSILRQPPRGNGLLQLAHQEIAAKLNIANGADGSCVAQTLAAVDASIGNLVIPPVGNGHLPPSPYVRTIGLYNGGGLCAPRCDSPPPPVPSPGPTARPRPTPAPRRGH